MAVDRAAESGVIRRRGFSAKYSDKNLLFYSNPPRGSAQGHGKEQ
jgi:hypothetical protein